MIASRAKNRLTAYKDNIHNSARRVIGIPVWEKLFVNLRSSCITDKDKIINNSYRMDAIFGNSDEIRQKHYRQPDTDEEYAALGNVSGVQGERVKNMSEKVSEFGQFTGIFAFYQDIIKRRLNYSDIVDILLTERGWDKERWKEFVNTNPIVGKFSTFVNSLLFDVYDETERRVSFFSLTWNVVKNACKGLFLIRQLHKQLAIPQSFGDIPDGENIPSFGARRILPFVLTSLYC